MDMSGDHLSGMTMVGVPGAHFGHYDCNGNPVSHSTGSYKGHVWPGFIFIAWALHWWLSAVVISKKDRSHVSRGWYPPLIRGLTFAESILKIFGPFLGLAMELRLDHSEWQSLFCSSGKWPGEFNTQHIHNWQHASAYPPFVVSGLVDVLGILLKLPEGTEKAFLAFAFGAEGFVITLHKKSEYFDAIVHALLAATMWAAAFFIALEIQFPKSLLLTGARSLATLLQGMWLVQVFPFVMSSLLCSASRFLQHPPPPPNHLRPLIALTPLVFFLAHTWADVCCRLFSVYGSARARVSALHVRAFICAQGTVCARGYAWDVYGWFVEETLMRQVAFGSIASRSAKNYF
eukprot:jgi/Botrbrau1/18841/Bobra.177_2s0006.1